MKKVLSVIIAMSFLFSTFSQKVDTTLTNLSDTNKITFSKVYSDIKSGITGLAEGLKVPAKHVYHILVKQQLTYSIINICLVLGIFIVCFLVARYAKITYKGHLTLYKQRTGRESTCLDDTPKGILSVALGVISIIIGIVGLIAFCVTIQETVIGIVNPEYGAIKEIISFVK